MFKWEKLEYFKITLKGNFNDNAAFRAAYKSVCDEVSAIMKKDSDAFFKIMMSDPKAGVIDIECSAEMASALKASSLKIIKDVTKVKPENSRAAPKIPKRQ